MIALFTYIGIISIFFGLMIFRGGGMAMREPLWVASFGLLLTGSLLGASLTIGVPHISRSLVYVMAGLMVAGCLGALYLVVDLAAPASTGMPCFMYGTGVSAVAMVGLGLISGGVWRRFPDPSFVLALGATGVGLAALHIHCPGVDALHLFGFHLGPLVVVYLLAFFALRLRSRILADGE